MSAKASKHSVAPNAAWLLEQGLVKPGSRILVRFKKNIDRPHLTHRIMRRHGVDDLRDITAVYVGVNRGLDPVHVTAVLTRLHQILKFRPDSDMDLAREALRLLVPTIQRSCAPRVNSLHYQFKMQPATACLWALAKLPAVVRSEAPSQVLDALLIRATRSPEALFECAPRTISLLLWSVSKLSRQALAPGSNDSSSSSSSGPSHLSDEAVSASVTKILNSRLSRTPGQATIWAFLRQASPAVIAQLSSSLGTLGRLTEPLADAVHEEFHYRMTSEYRLALKPFAGKDLVGVAQGFARAGHHEINKSLFAIIAARVHLDAQDLYSSRKWKAEHISHLASAFAAAGIRHDGMFRDMSAAARSRLEEFRSWSLVDLSQAYRTLGYSEAWLDAAVQQPQTQQTLDTGAQPATIS